MDFERDPTSVRERRCEGASTPIAQRTPEVVHDDVSDWPTELQSLVAEGSAGGIEMTTRGVPSARVTIALPVATACATTLFASARYSASVNTRDGVDPFWLSSAIASINTPGIWACRLFDLEGIGSSIANEHLYRSAIAQSSLARLREPVTSPRQFGSKLVEACPSTRGRERATHRAGVFGHCATARCTNDRSGIAPSTFRVVAT